MYGTKYHLVHTTWRSPRDDNDDDDDEPWLSSHRSSTSFPCHPPEAARADIVVYRFVLMLSAQDKTILFRGRAETKQKGKMGE